jgi:hypothetical protein
MMHRTPTIAALAAAAFLLAALPAAAWTFEIPFSARVNGHRFDKIKVQNDECKLAATLWFDAPRDGYASRSKVRNYHRFRARITFGNGKVVTSDVFGNRAPGRRIYTVRHDSSGDGCWAKQKAEVRNVDIEGCRARGCKVEEFE